MEDFTGGAMVNDVKTILNLKNDIGGRKYMNLTKNLVLSAVLILSSVGFGGCGNTNTLSIKMTDATYEIHAEDERFIMIDSINGWIYVDKKTKVQYLFIKRNNSGGLTILVDAEGNPLLYEE